jgi:hypothetical protein
LPASYRAAALAGNRTKVRKPPLMVG